MNDSLESHLVHGRRQRPDGPSPVDVISVQSQLVYGHAGNSAAVPPLRALGVRVIGMPEVRARGFGACLREAVRIATARAPRFGLSFDLDALDPRDAPGTGTPVPGGIQAADAIEALAGVYPMREAFDRLRDELLPIRTAGQPTAERELARLLAGSMRKHKAGVLDEAIRECRERLRLVGGSDLEELAAWARAVDDNRQEGR